MGRPSIFEELFKKLREPLPDSGKYLERIGMEPINKADKPTLDRLVNAHQRRVPFENLDVFDAQTDISLGIADLYDKIVTRRRGGYCFELNAAFSSLLTSLGYECYPVAVRIVFDYTSYMPLSHRATIVTIDGARYFCDVGFGGPSPQGAVMLDDKQAQRSGPNVFIFEKGDRGTFICRIVEDNVQPSMLFLETPCDPIDFLSLSEYQSKSKYSGFRASRMCNIITETGSITLGNNLLKIHSNGETVEKTLDTEDDIRAALKEYYGIEVDFQLKV